MHHINIDISNQNILNRPRFLLLNKSPGIINYEKKFSSFVSIVTGFFFLKLKSNLQTYFFLLIINTKNENCIRLEKQKINLAEDFQILRY